MAFKSYFDGGNQADSRIYNILTLASFSGTTIQWSNFERQWQANLKQHHADYLHTTDALSLQSDFSKDKGWSKAKVQALIKDCVTIIERCATKLVGTEGTVKKFGILPVTISVPLQDYQRAIQRVVDIGPVEEIVTMQSISPCVAYGVATDSRRYQFIFDQGEPFYGHIYDRNTNKASRKASKLFGSGIIALSQADMRYVPGLQAADLLAWSANRHYEDKRFQFPWQDKLLSISRLAALIDYDKLINPVHENIRLVSKFKLPKRRASR